MIDVFYFTGYIMRDFLRRFMNGRYGMDNLSRFLLIVWFGLAVLNIFAGKSYIYVISLVPAFFFFFRVLSTNKYKRSQENAKYVDIARKTGAFFRFQWQKLSEIGTHRYIKCPGCKAVIRVPRKTGKHTLVCPRCSKRFETNIII